jgi:hypothetical protein
MVGEMLVMQTLEFVVQRPEELQVIQFLNKHNHKKTPPNPVGHSAE